MSLYSLYLHLIVYPFSLLFCLRYLPLRQAIHIPILIAPNVKIGKMKRGRIVLTKCHRSMVIIGLPGTEGRGQCRSLLSVHRGGRLVVHGSAGRCCPYTMAANWCFMGVARWPRARGWLWTMECWKWAKDFSVIVTARFIVPGISPSDRRLFLAGMLI